MKPAQSTIIGVTMVLALAFAGTGLVSAQSTTPGNGSGIRGCINAHVRNRTTRRVDSRALRTCIRAVIFGGGNSSTSSMSSRSSSSRSNSSLSSSRSSSSTSSTSSMSSSRSSSSSMISTSSISSSRSSSMMSSVSSGIVNVTIQNFTYNPTPLVVKKGTTVRWTNNDSMDHTVTRDGAKGPFSGLLDQGESYSYTFNTVGTFPYHCMPHPDMKGTVQVIN